jgi:hypothetical protein
VAVAMGAAFQRHCVFRTPRTSPPRCRDDRRNDVPRKAVLKLGQRGETCGAVGVVTRDSGDHSWATRGRGRSCRALRAATRGIETLSGTDALLRRRRCRASRTRASSTLRRTTSSMTAAGASPSARRRAQAMALLARAEASRGRCSCTAVQALGQDCYARRQQLDKRSRPCSRGHAHVLLDAVLVLPARSYSSHSASSTTFAPPPRCRGESCTRLPFVHRDTQL